MENLWNELDESQDVNYKDNILSVPSFSGYCLIRFKIIYFFIVKNHPNKAGFYRFYNHEYYLTEL